MPLPQRQIEFAVQRGCWRSALELCKLLLSFDPDGDPLGAMLWMDYLCLRAAEFGYLRAVCEAWRQPKKLDWLPNFAYAEVGPWKAEEDVRSTAYTFFFSLQALAYFMEAQDTQETDAEKAETLQALGSLRLQQAMLRCGQKNGTPPSPSQLPFHLSPPSSFPSVLVHIIDKCRAHLKAEIFQHAHFQEPVRPNSSERNVELLAVLYAERSHTLYAPVHVLAWIEVCGRGGWGGGRDADCDWLSVEQRPQCDSPVSQRPRGAIGS